MKLLGPRITIDNTDSAQWLVTVQDLFDESDGVESISISVLVHGREKSPPELMELAIQRAIELLQGRLSVRK